MAGHSKWANIKHKKARQDAKRGKINTKLSRALTVAARDGADPDFNPRLRLAIDDARSNNMTKDAIERAIKKGAGGGDGDNLEEVIYEGYGPGGVAVMVECLTDNRNRTVAEVRHAFSKTGGNLGTDGSVAYLFTRNGVISFAQADEEKIMDIAIEAGANDVISNDDGSVDVITDFDQFSNVKEAMEKSGFNPDNAMVAQIASNQVELDLDGAEKMNRLIDMLEDLDDVQNVHSNAEFPDDVAG